MGIDAGDNSVAVGIAGLRLASSGLDSSAQALIGAMSSPPDATRRSAINTLVTALKAAGVWTLLDELWVYAAHTEQAALLGWKRNKDCLTVNSPTFTVDRGFAGNGTTSYLNTQFVPSTHGVNYTLNDASFGVYSRTDSQSSGADIGGRTASTSPGNQALMLIRTATDVNIMRINIDTAGGLDTTSVTSSLGLFVGRRTGAALTSMFRNGIGVEGGTGASYALPPYAMFVGALNTAGTAGLFTTREYAAAFVASSLSAGQHLSFFNALETYLDTVGAGVVS